MTVSPGSSPVGELLRQRRRQLGMSQGALAEAAGLPDDGTVARVERGELPASETLLRQLASALEIDWREIEALGIDQPLFSEVESPYKGLAAFRETDARLYFGRSAVSQLVVQKLAHAPLVALVGASGSGKSSLIAAGVLPTLRTTRSLAVLYLRPGSRPFDSFAVALHSSLRQYSEPGASQLELAELSRRLQEGQGYLEFERLLQDMRGEAQPLLIVDQFEEVFTQCREGRVRRQFIDLLLEIASGHGVSSDSSRILLALRGDFFAQVLADRALADALQDGLVHLPPMSRAELEEAIIRPAAAAQCHFDAGLVERIVDDAGDEPGRIPLVQYCLSLLWSVRKGNTLTMAAYEAIGGLDGAIAGQAERVFAGFGATGQRAARRLVTRLVRVAEAHEGSETRRRLPVGDAITTAMERSVLEALIGARLLTTDFDESLNAETVELAHEAVIGHWSRLKDWLVEDRQFLLWQQRLERIAKEWVNSSRDDGLVLRGKLLAESESWAEVRFDDVSVEVRELLAASVRVRDLEASARALEQASFLLTAQPAEVPRIIAALRTQREWLRGKLEEMLPTVDDDRAWRVQLALVPDDARYLGPLVNHLLLCTPEEFGVLLEGVIPYKAEIASLLWEILLSDTAARARLRAACALASFCPDDPRWPSNAARVAEGLVGENPLHLLVWLEPLSGIRVHLIPHVRTIMSVSGEAHARRESCALVLLQFAKDDAVLLSRIVAETSVEAFPLFFAHLRMHDSELVESELRVIIDGENQCTDESCRLAAGAQKAVAAVVLARLDRPDAIAHLFDERPDPEAATQFVHQSRVRGISPEYLARELLSADTQLKKYWLMLALGEFAREEIRSDLGVEVVDVLERWYAEDTAASVHSAAGWLLKSWHQDGVVNEIDSRITPWQEITSREWLTLGSPEHPLPFLRIPAGTYRMGCSATEAGAKHYETPEHEVRLSRAFGLCAREVTRREYERFVAATEHAPLPNIDDWSPTGEHPVVGLTWFEAQEYVSWLNSQWDVLSGSESRSHGALRLPTEAEWEKACRAGATTAFSFGSDRTLLGKYGWFQENSDLQTHPSRMLRPNRYGLYNMHGNCWEWCMDWYGVYSQAQQVDPTGPATSDWRVLRGGCWNLNQRYSRSACRNWHIPTNRNWYIGLRLAWEFVSGGHQ